MTGVIHSVFQNFKSSVKIIAVDLLVVGAGGGASAGQGGTSDISTGQGGNAARGATVSSSSNRVKINSSYTIQVGIAGSGGFQQSTSPFTRVSGTDGGSSSISGVFGVNTGLTAAGGLGTGSFGGGTVNGSSRNGLNTTGITPSTTNSITGSSITYGGGGGGGTARSYIGGSGAGANGSNPGRAGFGGNGGSTSFGWSGTGASGGNGAGGTVIMRCRQDAYTTFTQTNATVTTITVNNVTYKVFTWITGGTITFT